MENEDDRWTVFTSEQVFSKWGCLQSKGLTLLPRKCASR